MKALQNCRHLVDDVRWQFKNCKNKG